MIPRKMSFPLATCPKNVDWLALLKVSLMFRSKLPSVKQLREEVKVRDNCLSTMWGVGNNVLIGFVYVPLIQIHMKYIVVFASRLGAKTEVWTCQNHQSSSFQWACLAPSEMWNALLVWTDRIKCWSSLPWRLVERTLIPSRFHRSERILLNLT